MLIENPILFSAVIQQLLFVMTITLFIVVLAATQLADIEWLPDARKHIREFMPVFIALVVVLSGVIIKRIVK